MDKSKSIFVADNQGRARGYSPEEMLANQASSWQGWHCAAGVDNIFINSDGKVFIASCALGGAFGNVFKGGNELRKKWYVCTKSNCTCGADMRLLKVKNVEDIERVRQIDAEKLDYRSPMGEPTMVGKIWESDITINLNWDIGRRCNYSCSYCHPHVSNNYEEHKSWEQLSFAADEIERFFCQGRKGKWVFTGGEPTLNPHYLQLMQLIHSRGHKIHTQSNGSRNPEYYAELLKYSLIGFSVHLEFVKIERFVKVIETLIELKSRDRAFRWSWIGARIMSGPGRVSEARELRERLAAIPGSKEHLNQLVLAPLYDVETSTNLQPYPPGELETIIQYS